MSTNVPDSNLKYFVLFRACTDKGKQKRIYLWSALIATFYINRYNFPCFVAVSCERSMLMKLDVKRWGLTSEKMSNTPPSSRPKIEVVRLPSYEQAKLRPLLEGGIQLQAQFKHVRYGDYVSYSSLEDGNKQYFRYETRKRNLLLMLDIILYKK